MVSETDFIDEEIRKAIRQKHMADLRRSAPGMALELIRDH